VARRGAVDDYFDQTVLEQRSLQLSWISHSYVNLCNASTTKSDSAERKEKLTTFLFAILLGIKGLHKQLCASQPTC
jgi:hypothetical protein